MAFARGQSFVDSGHDEAVIPLVSGSRTVGPLCPCHGGWRGDKNGRYEMTRWRKLRERRDQRGAAAVEFGLVLIPMLYIIFATIQYGLYFYSMQAGSSAVNNAVRRVVVGNCTTTGQVQTLIYNNLGAATTASSPSGVTTTVTYQSADGTTTVASPGEIGGAVTVTATYPIVNLHFPFIPMPNAGTVTRTNVGRVEDLSSTQGTCS
jgi:Flp pilus assembly protein TadG